MNATQTTVERITVGNWDATPEVGMYVKPDELAYCTRLEAGLICEYWKCDFYMPLNSGGPIKQVAANIVVTGRTVQRKAGMYMVRVRIEFVGDGQPSTYASGYMQLKW